MANGAAGRSAPAELGRRRLRTIDCVAQSLAVGPVFAAAAVGSVLARLSGGLGPFVVVLTTVGVLGLGFLVSELARRFSGPGTVYEYVTHTLGRPTGVFAAGAYHLGALAIASGIPVVGGVLLKAFTAAHLGFDPPWWVASLGVLAVIAGVNVLGVKVTTRTQLVFVTASLLPFAVLAVAVVVDGGPNGNTATVFNPQNLAEGTSILDGLLFAILMFVGFELAAALGEEAARPHRSIPTAMLASILISGAVYVVTQYVGAIGSGGPTAVPFDFAALGEAYVNRRLGVLIELALLVAVVAVGIGFTAAASRGLFTLARDGLLPRRLAAVNRAGVPATATAAVVAIAVAVGVATLAVYGTAAEVDASGASTARPDALAAFEVTATTGAFVICVVYVLLAFGGILYFAFRDSAPGAVIAGLVGLVTAGAGVAAQFIDPTAPVGEARWGRDVGAVLLAVAFAWLIGCLVARRGAVATAGDRAGRHAP